MSCSPRPLVRSAQGRPSGYVCRKARVEFGVGRARQFGPTSHMPLLRAVVSRKSEREPPPYPSPAVMMISVGSLSARCPNNRWDTGSMCGDDDQFGGVPKLRERSNRWNAFDLQVWRIDDVVDLACNPLMTLPITQPVHPTKGADLNRPPYTTEAVLRDGGCLRQSWMPCRLRSSTRRSL